MDKCDYERADILKITDTNGVKSFNKIIIDNGQMKLRRIAVILKISDTKMMFRALTKSS